MLNVFAGFLSLFSKSSLQSGWADVIFLSLHTKVAMSPYWRYSLFQTPKLGCGATWSCESGRESAWSFYWHLFACRWLINIKQLFPCKHPRWIQVGVEHMFCLRAGTGIWIPHWVKDRRKGLHQKPTEQQPLGMNKYGPLLQSRRTKELAHDEIGL